MVSVIIPNYNHEPYLKKRIESVLCQTFQDFEIILLDDNSSDGSRLILEEYRFHPKVTKLDFSASNSGSPFGLWRKAFELAKGELIWIAESDDWADSLFLEKLIPYFEISEVVLAHCKGYNTSIDNYGEHRLTHEQAWDLFEDPLWSSNFVKNGRELLEKFGRFRCPVINVSSAIFKKSALQFVEIPSQYSYFGDWWFWSQLYAIGKVGFCSDYLNYIRYHPFSATGRKVSTRPKKFIENIKVAIKVAALVKCKFEYHKFYDWIIFFWLKEFQKTPKKFFTFIGPFLYLPMSFKMVFMIRVLRLYKERFIILK